VDEICTVADAIAKDVVLKCTRETSKLLDSLVKNMLRAELEEQNGGDLDVDDVSLTSEEASRTMRSGNSSLDEEYSEMELSSQSSVGHRGGRGDLEDDLVRGDDYSGESFEEVDDDVTDLSLSEPSLKS
jgi:hypothetical protein